MRKRHGAAGLWPLHRAGARACRGPRRTADVRRRCAACSRRTRCSCRFSLAMCSAQDWSGVIPALHLSPRAGRGRSPKRSEGERVRGRAHKSERIERTPSPRPSPRRRGEGAIDTLSLRPAAGTLRLWGKHGGRQHVPQNQRKISAAVRRGISVPL